MTQHNAALVQQTAAATSLEDQAAQKTVLLRFLNSPDKKIMHVNKRHFDDPFGNVDFIGSKMPEVDQERRQGFTYVIRLICPWNSVCVACKTSVTCRIRESFVLSDQCHYTQATKPYNA